MQKNRAASVVSVAVLSIITLATAFMLVGCSSSKGGSTARMENGAQVVMTELQPNTYEPITVEQGVPVKWNLKADQSKLSNCNGEIMIPELGIQKKLQAGDNIIEFTPEKTGSLTYTCWMGMITSTINVVDDLPN